MKDITQKRLKEVLHYDPDKGVFIWIKVSKYHREKMFKQAGGIQRDRQGRPHITIGIDGKLYQAHRLAFLYILGYFPETVDHMNGNPLDNRFSNLREVSSAENRENHAKRKKKSGLPLGVKKKSKTRYVARITINGKTLELGSFCSPEAASQAYLKAKRKYHYCPSAFPEGRD